MKKNEIIVTYGTEYRKMTMELLEMCNLAGMIGDRKKRVGIKPNLVSAVPASEGATTHPEVVEGLGGTDRYPERNGSVHRLPRHETEYLQMRF